MNLIKTVAFSVMAAALTACSTADAPQGTTRAASVAAPQIQRDYNLDSFRFTVPAGLKVSEANSYYPIADIVWRGDPLGDRPQQISEIFQTSIEAAGAELNGSVPVVVDVQLARFHSLTERTRYSVGGVHSIKFDLTVRHAQTGEILEPTRRINADVPGLGGTAAVAADNAGQGMKVRIIAHLTDLFQRELSSQISGAVTAGTDS